MIAPAIAHKSSKLDGSGEFQQTDREHEEEERVPASEGRGLLPALSSGNKAPVGTGRLQAWRADEMSPDRWREKAGDALGLD